jgi:predicted nuclease of predicted toxin-antitoxin system
LRFLVDAQLPPALARRIQSLGHHAEHVADCGLSQATDAEIRTQAEKTGAAIVTKDEDFAVHRLLHEGPSIVWVRIGNTRRAALLARFDTELTNIVAALERGETIVELT